MIASGKVDWVQSVDRHVTRSVVHDHWNLKNLLAVGKVFVIKISLVVVPGIVSKSKLDIFSSMLRLLQLQGKTFYNSVKIRIACVARKSMLSVVLVVLRGFSLSPGFPRTG